LLSRWRPFGVREAIYFLAAGREGRTLRILRREDLQVNDGHSAAEVVSLR
jgi:hypothetical protein